MSQVRFQADADLKQAIVTGAIRRQPKLNFCSANEAKLEGLKDPEVLDIAARDRRLLVTHDRKTMPKEFGEFVMTKTSFGVLIVSQSISVNEAIDTLILIWETTTAEEWINQIMSIPL
jgi:predicted nuclease of predicted toxin-antitoxin system